MRQGRREVRLGRAGDVVEGGAAAGLPLERKHRVGRAVRIGEGPGGGQLLSGQRCRVADQHGSDRCVLSRDIRYRHGHIGQHGLQHTVGVLVDGHHPHGEPHLVGSDLEGSSGGTRHLAGGEAGDGLEDAATRDGFHLPVVGHRTGDGATGVIGVADPLQGSGQQGADFRRAIVDAHEPLRPGIGTGKVKDAVGELQSLDAGQAVGAVTARHQVGDGHRAIGVNRPFVLGRQAPVGRGIQPRIALQDLPHYDQLAGVVGAGEHLRHHLGHAVEAGNLGPGAVQVLAHADAHVQPLVTVDQVVAAPPFDDVAAGTAENDVAAIEEGDTGAEELLQARDQCDVREHAALGARRGQGRRVGIVAGQHVPEGRARQPLDEVEAGQHRSAGARHQRLVEEAVGEVDGHAATVVLEGRPVEARGTDVAIPHAGAADHDVVTALGVELVVLATADVDVVAGDGVVAEGVEVVPGRTVRGPGLQPVVPFVAHVLLIGLGAQDEVVALAAEGLAGVFTGDDEVVAEAGEDQVDAVTALDHVVAVVALDVVVATHVRDDVVAIAAIDEVIAVAAIQPVIAAVPVEGVVTLAGAQDVVAGAAPQHHMVRPPVQQVIAVRPQSVRVVPHHQRQQRIVPQRIITAGQAQSGVLQRRVHFQGEGRRQEHHARQVGGLGIGHDQLAEGVAFQFGVEVEAGGALQVVEAVAVLEFLQLVLEHEVEGGAQHAAERRDSLGQATDPEVHQVEAGLHARPGAGAIEEVQPVGRRPRATQHDGRGRVPLAGQRGCAGDIAVGPVGGNEVDQRFRMLEVHHEVGPTDVRLEVAVAGGFVELRPRVVQGGHAGVATPGDVQRRQVQGQPHQVVAQGLGDELVDLVAHGAGHAPDDGAGGVLRIHPAGGVGQGVEEGGDQPQLLVVGGVHRVEGHRIEVGVETVNRLRQHRVAETVNRVGELGDDGRIEVDVIDLGRCKEQVDVGLDGPGELLEHQVLVLHLGAELGGLEQPLAVPLQGIDLGLGGREGRDRAQQPFIDEGDIVARQHRGLGLLHQAVVLGVEDRMHRRQADVLVDPAIARHVVGVQQLVVIGARRRGTAHVDDAIGIGRQPAGRIGGMGDVDEELVPGTDCVGQVHRRQWIALHQDGGVIGGPGDAVGTVAGADHHLREAVGALDEVAIGVGGQQRHIEHIGVGEVDAEDVTGLGLDHRPGGHATDLRVIGGTEATVRAQVAVGDQPAGGMGLAIGTHLVGPQEHLVGRVRAVGLVLVDEGRGGVHRLAGIVGGPEYAVGAGSGHLGGAGQHHEVGRAAGHEQRVVRLQRNEHGAGATLGHQIQAVVEELTEEGHPGIEGRGEPFVRRYVGDEVHLLVIGGPEQPVQARAGHQGGAVGATGGRHRRRVAVGLVDDQVADGARVAVHHIGGGVVVGIADTEERRLVLLVGVFGRQQAREGVVGSAELALVETGEVQQVVEFTGHRPQAGGCPHIGHQGQQVGAGGMGLGDADLRQDEVQVSAHQLHPGATGRDGRPGLHRRSGRGRREGVDRGGRRGEHLLGHAMGILIDALDANRQPGDVRCDPEAFAVGALEGQVPGGGGDDVLEQPRAGHPLDLPHVGDVRRQAAGIVTVVDTRGGDREEIPHLQAAAILVGHGQLAEGLGIQAGHQHLGAIGELDTLDVGESIDAIAAGDRIGDGEGTVAVVHHAVVRGQAPVVGGVEVGVTGEDLAHRHQLPGVVGAVQHQRDQVQHAVEGGDLRAAAIGVGPHADAHVEPAVAVDQVIAAATLDDVAAAAAEDDVAADEGIHQVVPGAQHPIGAHAGLGAEEGPQPVDQVQVGERTAGGAAMVDDGGGVHVIAAQDIGEVGA
ncbi:hypothetical protein ppKF707_2357 [Metapseudomonas furukawaii]|nr:hypothetical protein ppKF707_2357 [Pseudomonas furukawaii]